MMRDGLIPGLELINIHPDKRLTVLILDISQLSN